MKFLQLLKTARYWVVTLFVGAAFIFAGILLSKVDNGADITPIEHIIRERVITDEVTIWQSEDANYLFYHGEKHNLPTSKIIQLGESIQDYEDVGNKKIVKSIFFDSDSQDYVYREETITKSYSVEKIKKEKASNAAWAYMWSIFAWVIGVIATLIAIALFLFWLDDLREFHRRN